MTKGLEGKSWFDRNYTKTFFLLLLIVWASLLTFFYLKADEVTKDPCRVCSERMGEKVVCTTGDVFKAVRTYYPNGSVVQESDKVLRKQPVPNFSNYTFKS